MLNTFWSYIQKSLEHKAGGKISATRISSYLILGSILTTSAVYILIDLINAIEVWRKDTTYTIPSEHIVIFGMILAHHLTLLGINKNAETKQLDSSKQTEKKEPEKNSNAKNKPEDFSKDENAV